MADPHAAVHPEFEAALGVLDTWLEARREYESYPSVSAGVVLGGKMVWAAGYGMSSRRRDCHFTDTPVSSILKHLLKGEGIAAE